MKHIIIEKAGKQQWSQSRKGKTVQMHRRKALKLEEKAKIEAESLARAKQIMAKYPTWEAYHESQRGKTYKDFIGRPTVIGDAEHERRNSRYYWEAAKKWVDAGGSPAKLNKGIVQPFARVVMGHVQRVKGWLTPEKRKSYTPTTRGVMDYINDHMGIQGYTDILKRAAKESTYIMEGVQSAFLDVTNKGRGTFERMAKTNPKELKPFLAAILAHVQDDIVALRTDLRKGRGKDKKPRKKRGSGYHQEESPYTQEELSRESRPQSRREQMVSIRRILRGE